MEWLNKNKAYLASIVYGIVGILVGAAVIDEKTAVAVGGVVMALTGVASTASKREAFNGPLPPETPTYRRNP